MAEHDFNNEWVDRYIRDELSDEDEATFEEALLEDPALQADVEAALGIREALKKESILLGPSEVTPMPAGNQWTSLAMAASVLLAVVSTTMFWRGGIENNRLQEQVEALRQPRASVLQVPVNIMRSSSNSTPDVIVQKPAGQGAIVLNIELSPTFQNLSSIQFALQQIDKAPVISWTGQPGSDGRISVVLNNEVIPDGLVQLQMTSPDRKATETRLLEFRPHQN